MSKRPSIDIDPLSNLLTVLKANNPLLANADQDTLLPYRVGVGSNGKNSRLFLVANQTAGLSGTIAIDYDRIDPVPFFTKFGTLTRNPILRYFGKPGDVVTVANLLDGINHLLGVKLAVTGAFPDLQEKNYTLPTKTGSMAITVDINTATAGKISLRF